MALPIADRVKDATLTIGTGNITLSNTAPAGYQTFLAGFGSSTSRNVCYCISNPNSPYEWEIGYGAYTSATNTLARGTVLSNSAGTQPTKINFPAGTKDVFCTTASKSMLVQNSSGDIDIPNTGQQGSVSIRPELTSAGYAATAFNFTCPTPTLAAQNGTYLDISAGAGSTTGDGGYANLAGGSAPGSGAGGDVFLVAGGSLSGVGGNIQITAGDGSTVGGDINLTSGGVPSGVGSGGNISIDAGVASGAGSNGQIKLSLGGVSAITIQPADATTTAAAKIGLFDATPVVRPTIANTTAGTFIVSSGTAVNTASTFSGYTVGQIAAALVKLGILT